MTCPHTHKITTKPAKRVCLRCISTYMNAMPELICRTDVQYCQLCELAEGPNTFSEAIYMEPPVYKLGMIWGQ